MLSYSLPRLVWFAIPLLVLALPSAFGQTAVAAAPDFSWLAHDKDFEDVSNLGNVHVDLRYASDNNFMKKNIYGDFHQCYLERVAAEKFRKASEILKQEKPGWKFLIFDCLRPRSLQVKLFDYVKGTPQQMYVANPKDGSVHNYGFAMDLSLEDENGHDVDMGTGFDNFTHLAQPKREQENLEAGKLTQEQIDHRMILRKIMKQAGFLQLPIEWWHYDGLPKKELKAHYKIVE